MPFPYKRVLMIGATSGIGAALAERLVQEGSFVIAVGRRKENLAEFVQKVGHEKAQAVPFDISELEKIPHFVTNITGTYPDLDCVFINSGMQRGFDFKDPSSVDLSLFSQEFSTNYISYIHLTHAFLPFLLKSCSTSPRSLIYTTSNLSVVPIARCPGYCASKAALHHFILTLRSQLADTGIKIQELLPPAVQTELHDEKHQPDIKHGGSMGMPLPEFTDAAYDMLASGKESCIVNPGKAMQHIHEIEAMRQEDFWRMDGLAKGNK